MSQKDQLHAAVEAMRAECEQISRDMVLYTGFDVAEKIASIDVDAFIEQDSGINPDEPQAT